MELKSSRQKIDKKEAVPIKNAPIDWDCEKEKQLDDTVIGAIQALDLFIAQATSMGMGTMARILNNAKEDLVFWAVDMNFHETKIDKFTNQLLYSNSLFVASDLIDKLSTNAQCSEKSPSREFLTKMIPIFSIVEKLRLPKKNHPTII